MRWRVVKPWLVPAVDSRLVCVRRNGNLDAGIELQSPLTTDRNFRLVCARERTFQEFSLRAFQVDLAKAPMPVSAPNWQILRVFLAVAVLLPVVR